jgi:stearoyl-CoA desaturase (delta-9 desaturase)
MWMIPVAHIAGVISCAIGFAWLIQGIAPWWVAVWIAGHVCGSLAVSVGLHRYFTHGSFETSQFWHWVLAFYSTLTVQGSALGWAAAHTTHHVHADTDGDPHRVDLSYLIYKRYRDVPMVGWRVRHLVKDPAVAVTHRYGLLLILGWAALLFTLGGVELLVYGYLAPLGTTHLVGAVHQVTTHRGGVARDLPWLEWLLPAAGEWMHGHHHENPRNPRLGGLDYGWLFIRFITRT